MKLKTIIEEGSVNKNKKTGKHYDLFVYEGRLKGKMICESEVMEIAKEIENKD